MDKYPWLDLTNKNSIRNTPFQLQIMEHMESTIVHNSPNDEDYVQYLAEDEKECPLFKSILLDYEKRLEQYHQELDNYKTYIQAGMIHGAK
jgi:hypothetical protein